MLQFTGRSELQFPLKIESCLSLKKHANSAKFYCVSRIFYERIPFPPDKLYYRLNYATTQ